MRLLTDRFADGKPQNNELFEEGFDVRVPWPELQRKGAFVQISQIGRDLWVNEMYEAQLLVSIFCVCFVRSCLMISVQVART